MNAQALQIYTDAMKLSPTEREELAVHLMSSLGETGNPGGDPANAEGKLSEAWDAEIAKRIDEIRSGAVETIPADQVMQKINQIVDRNA